MNSYIPLYIIKKTLDVYDYEFITCKKHHIRKNTYDKIENKINKIHKSSFKYYFFLNFCLKYSFIDFSDDKIMYCINYITNSANQLNYLHFK